MTRRTYSRDDVDTYYTWSRERLPSINVKTSGYGWEKEAARVAADNDVPGFTSEWCEANISEDTANALWEWAIESGREDIANDADLVYEDTPWSPKCSYDGRSGGHLVVDGLPDLDEWDAVLLGKWRRFERYVRAIVDDQGYRMADMAWANMYEAEQDELRKRVQAEAWESVTV
jgi:hypothetical protein